MTAALTDVNTDALRLRLMPGLIKISDGPAVNDPSVQVQGIGGHGPAGAGHPGGPVMGDLHREIAAAALGQIHILQPENGGIAHVIAVHGDGSAWGDLTNGLHRAARQADVVLLRAGVGIHGVRLVQKIKAQLLRGYVAIPLCQPLPQSDEAFLHLRTLPQILPLEGLIDAVAGGAVQAQIEVEAAIGALLDVGVQDLQIPLVGRKVLVRADEIAVVHGQTDEVKALLRDEIQLPKVGLRRPVRGPMLGVHPKKIESNVFFHSFIRSRLSS